MLELDDLPGFGAKISGMSKSTQQVDLGGFTFSTGETVSWAQTGTSGTLTVMDGAKVAHLTLIGTYTSNSFMLSNDTHGGTLVADPPALRFVEAMAGFHDGRDQGFAAIHAGGSALVSAPAFVTAATSGR